jgi:hypothetical protein
MSVRRSMLGLVAAAAIALSACAGGTATSAPSLAIPSVPASISAEGLEGFCADFVSELQTDWPNIDQATATALGAVVSEWATMPALSTVSADVQTIGTWLTTAATSASAASPPPNVVAAFDNIQAFAESNC